MLCECFVNARTSVGAFTHASDSVQVFALEYIPACLFTLWLLHQSDAGQAEQALRFRCARFVLLSTDPSYVSFDTDRVAVAGA